MNRHLHRLHRDERGMSFVFVGMGFLAFLAATTLAIDVGMFMTARSQAQNSADAGALAGATALAFDDYNNRSSSGPAVQNTLQAARSNDVMGAQVDVKAPDVTFPLSPSGVNNRVSVTVYRTAARGNPVDTMMGKYFGVLTADITAMATAEASPANAETCVKPFTIPDKWIEKQDPGGWDPLKSTFDMYDNKNQELDSPDVYIPRGQDGYTGYDPVRDRGMPLMVRAGTGNNIAPSFYFSYAIGGITGGDEYRWNIANCNTTVMEPGQLITQEPGDMMGPTIQGVEDLIARDPNARWDDDKRKVVSRMNPSPRVAIIPVYDPVYYEEGKHNGRNADLKIANFIGFFIESLSGNTVYGRVTPITGLVKGNGGVDPTGSFPVSIRLVE